jgi:four helix bundle protein
VTTFDHERLDVYQLAVEFLGHADELAVQFPTGRAYLADQLHRASTSIVLNIAEGAGEFSKRDKARFYRMALRSATECAAINDVCKRLKLAAMQGVETARGLLLRIVSMLVQLVRSVGGTGRKTKTGTGTGTGTGGKPR